MKKFLFVAGSLMMLVACTKDKSMEDSQEGVSATATKSEQSFNQVHIFSTGFSPDSLMVNINNNVTWVNQDARTHTVTSEKFDSGDITPGAAYKYYFDNTGSYYYYCRYHGERGVIVVTGIR